MQDITFFVGTILLGGVFVSAGVQHFLNFKSVGSMMAERGFPAPRLLLAAGSILEIVAGLALILGIARRYAALALIVFTISASLMLLDFWRHDGPERETMRSSFLINIAVIGGLLVAASVDDVPAIALP